MYSPYDKIFEPDALELILPTNNTYKGSFTKEGNNPKVIAKRRKRNKNKKTHRNAKW